MCIPVLACCPCLSLLKPSPALTCCPCPSLLKPSPGLLSLPESTQTKPWPAVPARVNSHQALPLSAVPATKPLPGLLSLPKSTHTKPCPGLACCPCQNLLTPSCSAASALTSKTSLGGFTFRWLFFAVAFRKKASYIHIVSKERNPTSLSIVLIKQIALNLIINFSD